MSNKRINRVSRNLILGTSSATRGAFYHDMQLQEPDEKRKDIVWALKQTSWFERLWYPIFFIAGILCLILIRPFNYELVFAVLSLFIYMFANNLLARGKLLGIFLSIFSATLYTIVSFIAKVYGEAIINIALYIPLDIIAIITFKKNQNKNTDQLDVRAMNVKNAMIWLGITALMEAIIFVILYFLPGQIFPLLNSLSVTLFLVALLVRNFRFKEFWWFNLLGNAVSIILWGVVATSASELIFGLPFAISSLAALLNNIYGIVVWQRMYRAAKYNGGIYVKKKVKINHVIKIRRRYENYLKWNEEVEEKRKIRLEKSKKH